MMDAALKETRALSTARAANAYAFIMQFAIMCISLAFITRNILDPR
jgi:hypothetical protein